MNASTAPPQLGPNVLVILDKSPGFLDALRSVAASLPYIPHTLFTLFCCCPTRYWEHGGADDPDVKRQLEDAWKAAEKEFDLARHCLNQARSVLQDAGVPDSHICTRISTEQDSLIAATTAEVRAGHYSGVIVHRTHDDIVNRLLQKGVTDRFRRLPEVEVWAIDTE